MITFRDLTASEINVRVASVTDTEKTQGLSLLLYKDARCDANILDETVGTENWTNRFYECKGNLFCSLGIRQSANEEFIFKDDCGSESNTEKEKGEASDAFKRAGFKWGIGRELYTAPFIWVKGTDCNIKDKKCRDNFRVKHIKIVDKKIVELVIFNDKTKKDCFTYGMNKPVQATDGIGRDKANEIVNLANEKNSDINKILKYYKVKNLKDLTEEQYAECIAMLNKK